MKIIILTIICAIILALGYYVVRAIYYLVKIDYTEECGNCKYYDLSLGCCKEDNIARPENCKACAVFRHYRDKDDR